MCVSMNSDRQVSLNVTRKKYPRVLSKGGLSTTVTAAFKRWCCAEV